MTGGKLERIRNEAVSGREPGTFRRRLSCTHKGESVVRREVKWDIFVVKIKASK